MISLGFSEWMAAHGELKMNDRTTLSLMGLNRIGPVRELIKSSSKALGTVPKDVAAS